MMRLCKDSDGQKVVNIGSLRTSRKTDESVKAGEQRRSEIERFEIIGRVVVLVLVAKVIIVLGVIMLMMVTA